MEDDAWVGACDCTDNTLEWLLAGIVVLVLGRHVIVGGISCQVGYTGRDLGSWPQGVLCC